MNWAPALPAILIILLAAAVLYLANHYAGDRYQ